MILVIDVGTTGLRAAIVRPDASLASVEYRPLPPSTPFPGLVEFDPVRLAELVIDAATTVLRRTGNPPVDGVVTIDFSGAYLPPCSFSDHYLCPMPAASNRLETAITAGERRVLRAP